MDLAIDRARAAAALRLLRRLRHDLATPLSGAALHLEMARRRLANASPDPQRALESLGLAQREVAYTAAILQPLTELLTHAEEPLEEIGLRECIVAGARRNEAEAARKGIAMALPQGKGPLVVGKPRQTEDAFAALTSEAVRSCPDGGELTWSVENAPAGPRAICEIPGRFATENLDGFFATRRSDIGGAEMSLFLARFTLESQGGELTLERADGTTRLSVQLTSP